MKLFLSFLIALICMLVTVTVAENAESTHNAPEEHETLEESTSSQTKNKEKTHSKKKHRHNRTEEAEYEISDDLMGILGVKHHHEAIELIHQLTGHRDEASAVKYIENITGLSDEHNVYDFLLKSRGSRSWKFVVDFLKHMDETPHISIIVELLRQITNENDVLQAYMALKPLIGHEDFDGVYETLQKISGEKDPYEVADYFKHIAHTNDTILFVNIWAWGMPAVSAACRARIVLGVEGFKLEVLKLTTGIGPSEFPRLLKILLSEIDMKGAFNLIVLGTRTVDIGEAIKSLNKLLRTNSFADSIIILRTITKQAQTKYALEELTQSLNRGSLRLIVKNLYQITGTENLLEANTIFKNVFGMDDVVSVIQRINVVTKRRDPLYFLNSLLDVTTMTNIKDAVKEIRTLTVNHMPILDMLEKVRIKSGHEDIVDFFRKLISITGAKSIQEAWQAIINVTTIRDIFVFFGHVNKYTQVEIIVFLETILRVTNTTNLRVAAALLNKISDMDDFFEVIQVILDITKMDTVKFFENVITLSKSFYLQESVMIIEDYTDTENFIDALRNLPRATGQSNILRAIEYIKQNKPRIPKSTTTSTTTTSTMSSPTTTEDDYDSSEEDYEEEHEEKTSTDTTIKITHPSTTEQSSTVTQVSKIFTVSNATPEALVTITTKPATVMVEKQITVIAPITTTKIAATTSTKEPTFVSKETRTTTQKSTVASTEQRALPVEKTITTIEPAIITDKVIVATAESEITTAEPTTSTTGPTASTAEPLTSMIELTSATAEPTIATANPAVELAFEAITFTEELAPTTVTHIIPVKRNSNIPIQTATELTNMTVEPIATITANIITPAELTTNAAAASTRVQTTISTAERMTVPTRSITPTIEPSTSTVILATIPTEPAATRPKLNITMMEPITTKPTTITTELNTATIEAITGTTESIITMRQLGFSTRESSTVTVEPMTTTAEFSSTTLDSTKSILTDNPISVTRQSEFISTTENMVSVPSTIFTTKKGYTTGNIKEANNYTIDQTTLTTIIFGAEKSTVTSEELTTEKEGPAIITNMSKYEPTENIWEELITSTKIPTQLLVEESSRSELPIEITTGSKSTVINEISTTSSMTTEIPLPTTSTIGTTILQLTTEPTPIEENTVFAGVNTRAYSPLEINGDIENQPITPEPLITEKITIRAVQPITPDLQIVKINDTTTQTPYRPVTSPKSTSKSNLQDLVTIDLSLEKQYEEGETLCSPDQLESGESCSEESYEEYDLKTEKPIAEIFSEEPLTTTEKQSTPFRPKSTTVLPLTTTETATKYSSTTIMFTVDDASRGPTTFTTEKIEYYDSYEDHSGEIDDNITCPPGENEHEKSEESTLHITATEQSTIDHLSIIGKQRTTTIKVDDIARLLQGTDDKKSPQQPVVTTNNPTATIAEDKKNTPQYLGTLNSTKGTEESSITIETFTTASLTSAFNSPSTAEETKEITEESRQPEPKTIDIEYSTIDDITVTQKPKTKPTTTEILTTAKESTSTTIKQINEQPIATTSPPKISTTPKEFSTTAESTTTVPKQSTIKQQPPVTVIEESEDFENESQNPTSEIAELSTISTPLTIVKDIFTYSTIIQEPSTTELPFTVKNLDATSTTNTEEPFTTASVPQSKTPITTNEPTIMMLPDATDQVMVTTQKSTITTDLQTSRDLVTIEHSIITEPLILTTGSISDAETTLYITPSIGQESHTLIKVDETEDTMPTSQIEKGLMGTIVISAHNHTTDVPLTATITDDGSISTREQAMIAGDTLKLATTLTTIEGSIKFDETTTTTQPTTTNRSLKIYQESTENIHQSTIGSKPTLATITTGISTITEPLTMTEIPSTVTELESKIEQPSTVPDINIIVEDSTSKIEQDMKSKTTTKLQTTTEQITMVTSEHQIGTDDPSTSALMQDSTAEQISVALTTPITMQTTITIEPQTLSTAAAAQGTKISKQKPKTESLFTDITTEQITTSKHHEIITTIEPTLSELNTATMPTQQYTTTEQFISAVDTSIVPVGNLHSSNQQSAESIIKIYSPTASIKEVSTDQDQYAITEEHLTTTEETSSIQLNATILEEQSTTQEELVEKQQAIITEKPITDMQTTILSTDLTTEVRTSTTEQPTTLAPLEAMTTVTVITTTEKEATTSINGVDHIGTIDKLLLTTSQAQTTTSEQSFIATTDSTITKLPMIIKQESMAKAKPHSPEIHVDSKPSITESSYTAESITLINIEQQTLTSQEQRTNTVNIELSKKKKQEAATEDRPIFSEDLISPELLSTESLYATEATLPVTIDQHTTASQKQRSTTKQSIITTDSENNESLTTAKQESRPVSSEATEQQSIITTTDITKFDSSTTLEQKTTTDIRPITPEKHIGSEFPLIGSSSVTIEEQSTTFQEQSPSTEKSVITTTESVNTESLAIVNQETMVEGIPISSGEHVSLEFSSTESSYTTESTAPFTTEQHLAPQEQIMTTELSTIIKTDIVKPETPTTIKQETTTESRPISELPLKQISYATESAAPVTIEQQSSTPQKHIKTTERSIITTTDSVNTESSKQESNSDNTPVSSGGHIGPALSATDSSYTLKSVAPGTIQQPVIILQKQTTATKQSIITTDKSTSSKEHIMSDISLKQISYTTESVAPVTNGGQSTTAQEQTQTTEQSTITTTYSADTKSSTILKQEITSESRPISSPELMIQEFSTTESSQPTQRTETAEPEITVQQLTTSQEQISTIEQSSITAIVNANTEIPTEKNTTKGRPIYTEEHISSELSMTEKSYNSQSTLPITIEQQSSKTPQEQTSTTEQSIITPTYSVKTESSATITQESTPESRLISPEESVSSQLSSTESSRITESTAPVTTEQQSLLSQEKSQTTEQSIITTDSTNTESPTTVRQVTTAKSRPTYTEEHISTELSLTESSYNSESTTPVTTEQQSTTWQEQTATTERLIITTTDSAKTESSTAITQESTAESRLVYPEEYISSKLSSTESSRTTKSTAPVIIHQQSSLSQEQIQTTEQSIITTDSTNTESSTITMQETTAKSRPIYTAGLISLPITIEQQSTTPQEQTSTTEQSIITPTYSVKTESSATIMQESTPESRLISPEESVSSKLSSTESSRITESTAPVTTEQQSLLSQEKSQTTEQSIITTDSTNTESPTTVRQVTTAKSRPTYTEEHISTELSLTESSYNSESTTPVTTEQQSTTWQEQTATTERLIITTTDSAKTESSTAITQESTAESRLVYPEEYISSKLSSTESSRTTKSTAPVIIHQQSSLSQEQIQTTEQSIITTDSTNTESSTITMQETTAKSRPIYTAGLISLPITIEQQSTTPQEQTSTTEQSIITPTYSVKTESSATIMQESTPESRLISPEESVSSKLSSTESSRITESTAPVTTEQQSLLSQEKSQTTEQSIITTDSTNTESPTTVRQVTTAKSRPTYTEEHISTELSLTESSYNSESTTPVTTEQQSTTWQEQTATTERLIITTTDSAKTESSMAITQESTAESRLVYPEEFISSKLSSTESSRTTKSTAPVIIHQQSSLSQEQIQTTEQSIITTDSTNTESFAKIKQETTAKSRPIYTEGHISSELSLAESSYNTESIIPVTTEQESTTPQEETPCTEQLIVTTPSAETESSTAIMHKSTAVSRLIFSEEQISSKITSTENSRPVESTGPVTTEQQSSPSQEQTPTTEQSIITTDSANTESSTIIRQETTAKSRPIYTEGLISLPITIEQQSTTPQEQTSTIEQSIITPTYSMKTESSTTITQESTPESSLIPPEESPSSKLSLTESSRITESTAPVTTEQQSLLSQEKSQTTEQSIITTDSTNTESPTTVRQETTAKSRPIYTEEYISTELSLTESSYNTEPTIPVTIEQKLTTPQEQTPTSVKLIITTDGIKTESSTTFSQEITADGKPSSYDEYIGSDLPLTKSLPTTESAVSANTEQDTTTSQEKTTRNEQLIFTTTDSANAVSSKTTKQESRAESRPDTYEKHIGSEISLTESSYSTAPVTTEQQLMTAPGQTLTTEKSIVTAIYSANPESTRTITQETTATGRPLFQEELISSELSSTESSSAAESTASVTNEQKSTTFQVQTTPSKLSIITTTDSAKIESTTEIMQESTTESRLISHEKHISSELLSTESLHTTESTAPVTIDQKSAVSQEQTIITTDSANTESSTTFRQKTTPEGKLIYSEEQLATTTTATTSSELSSTEISYGIESTAPVIIEEQSKTSQVETHTDKSINATIDSTKTESSTAVSTETTKQSIITTDSANTESSTTVTLETIAKNRPIYSEEQSTTTVTQEIRTERRPVSFEERISSAEFSSTPKSTAPVTIEQLTTNSQELTSASEQSFITTTDNADIKLPTTIKHEITTEGRLSPSEERISSEFSITESAFTTESIALVTLEQQTTHPDRSQDQMTNTKQLPFSISPELLSTERANSVTAATVKQKTVDEVRPISSEANINPELSFTESSYTATTLVISEQEPIISRDQSSVSHQLFATATESVATEMTFDSSEIDTSPPQVWTETSNTTELIIPKEMKPIIPIVEPRPPGSATEKAIADSDLQGVGGKLGINQGKKDILNALESNMNLKVLLLPNGPKNKNCFCTCDSSSSPQIIPLSELP